MGAAEIFLALIVLVPGVVVVSLLRGAKFWPRAAERPAYPARAGAIAVGAALVGAGVGVGLGWLSFEAVVPRAVPLGIAFVASSPWDNMLARLHFGVFGAVWLALPGACALGWLIVSHRREPTQAALFGIVVGLGFGAGAAVALATAASGLSWLLPETGLEATVSFLSVVDVVVDGLIGFGVAGAMLAGAAFVASRSPRVFKAALASTGLATGLGCLVSGWLTPPDVVSQVVLGAVLVFAWLLGLVVAAVRLTFTRRGTDVGPAPRAF